MKRKTQTHPSFDELFPTLAEWIRGFGWVEIGDDDGFSPSFIRVLDAGGMVWESDADFDTVDAALRAAETHVEELMVEEGHRKPARASSSSGGKRVIAVSARKLVDAIRSQLVEADYDSSVDWEAVSRALRSLLDAGYADEVVNLGEEILEAAADDIEHYDHEGEVAGEAEVCVAVVFDAINRSDLSPAEQLDAVFDLLSEDEYSLCADGFEQFWRAERPKAEWAIFAGEFEKRMGRLKEGAAAYGRKRFADLLAEAMRKAGRAGDATELLEREAVEAGRYDSLVEHLVAIKRWDDAEAWSRRALAAAGVSLYDLARWRGKIHEIREKRGDWPGAAALRVEQFIADPGEPAFRAMLKDAKKASAQTEVEAWARRFLETGELPPSGAAKERPAGGRGATKAGGGTKARRRSERSWPLPDPELPRPKLPEAPMASALLEIALAEKKPAEVVRWYDLRGPDARQGYYADRLDGEVARAIVRVFPDRAVEIWKRLAEREIATTKTRAYPVAAGYLRSVKETLVREKRGGEWDAYLGRLLEANRRKTSCVRELERLGRAQG